ncbi:GNAT family N-acetyltransferase [Streptomyces sp. NPDC090306]|uniref:GNAT family N-acetyltransferase n=1 Tax=Streptomyces sp. NPDC090306 TaxID=3365961 RepID=UPI003800E08C
MTGSAGVPRVRAARPGDMAQVAELAAEHAAFEKASPPPADLAGRLERLLFADGARLRCFVADPGGDDGRLLGYATCAPEMSTWHGTEYLHMDCLFLRDGSRGHGLGPRLVAAVVEEARRLGLDAVQWNTPDWNVDAVRFYDRLGARSSNKRRFTLQVEPAAARGRS